MKKLLILALAMFLLALPFIFGRGEILMDCKDFTEIPCSDLGGFSIDNASVGAITEHANGTMEFEGSESNDVARFNMTINFSNFHNTTIEFNISITDATFVASELGFFIGTSNCNIAGVTGRLFIGDQVGNNDPTYFPERIFDADASPIATFDTIKVFGGYTTWRVTYNPIDGNTSYWNETFSGSGDFRMIGSYVTNEDPTTLCSVHSSEMRTGSSFDVNSWWDDFLIYNDTAERNATAAPPADNPPTLDSVSMNNTNPILNEVVGTSAQFSDDNALSTIFAAHNQSGSFVNFTSVNITGTVTTYNFSPNVTATLEGAVVGLLYTANDSIGQSLQAVGENFTVQDLTPPATSPKEKAISLLVLTVRLVVLFITSIVSFQIFTSLVNISSNERKTLFCL